MIRMKIAQILLHLLHLPLKHLRGDHLQRLLLFIAETIIRFLRAVILQLKADAIVDLRDGEHLLQQRDRDQRRDMLRMITLFFRLRDQPGLDIIIDHRTGDDRILFIKHSDSTSMDDFLELKGQLIPQDQLTDEQRPYYNYTCQLGDFIKTCSVPSPLLNEKDLEREKRMLEI